MAKQNLALDNVIKEMKEDFGDDYYKEMHEIYSHSELDAIENFIIEYMRLACEAMAGEIVPEEDKDYNRNELDDEYQRGYNACRSDILERAEKFKGEKK